MTLLERWFDEVWNKGREDAIDEMILPDAATHGLEHPDGTAVEGRQAFRAFHKQLTSSFSDIHVDVVQTLTEGDMTMARCVVTARHTGDGLGMQATRRQVKFTGMCLVRLKDGKVAEAWNNFDLGTIYRQLSLACDPCSQATSLETKPGLHAKALINWP